MYHNSIASALEHLSNLSYLKIYFTILASGHPLPVPEAIVFMALGLLAATTQAHFLGYICVAALAAFTYDVVLYTLAYMGSKIASSLSRHVKSAWSDRYNGATSMHMFFLTFISHFVPGWRMVNPIIAAGIKVPPKKFVFYSLVSALIYPALYISAGFLLTII